MPGTPNNRPSEHKCIMPPINYGVKPPSVWHAKRGEPIWDRADDRTLLLNPSLTGIVEGDKHRYQLSGAGGNDHRKERERNSENTVTPTHSKSNCKLKREKKKRDSDLSVSVFTNQ